MNRLYQTVRGGRQQLCSRPRWSLARGPVARYLSTKPPAPKILGLRMPRTLEEAEKLTGPKSEELINDPDTPMITWYEQDLDRAAPQRLVERLATPEDRRRHNELSKMLEEDANNPNYDDATLNRILLDDLMKDPYFADLTDDLQAMREGIMTREEARVQADKWQKETEPEAKEFEAGVNLNTHESLQRLIDDPELADIRRELQELRDTMPGIQDNPDDPEFQERLSRVEEKLAGNEAFQRKLAALEAEQGGSRTSQDTAQLELSEISENDPIQTPEDLDKLLLHMKDLMQSMGGDRELEAELDAVINDNPSEETEGDLEREMDFNELAIELAKLAKKSSLPGTAAPKAQDCDENVDPELEAKVDRIMQDPKLMEKLMYIKNIIEQEQKKVATLVDSKHASAPDPLTLNTDRVTSLKHRLETARSDPEHVSALQALRVNLLPPFSATPALKTFNEAIEFAYIGANDDIRRILWRAYSKARTLPTFLQNLSDDAWDILYYSQAVNWGSNQNRRSHLDLLLRDLRSVGKDGPPTDPSTLAQD